MTVSIYNVFREKDGKLACAKQAAVNSTDYYLCMCNGLVSGYGEKKVYCETYWGILAKENDDVLQLVGYIVGGVVLSLLLVLLLARYMSVLKKLMEWVCVRLGGRSCGGACWRMFCCCCQVSTKTDPGVIPNANMASLSGNACWRCLNAPSVLALVEFFCDCDCFQARRTPRPPPSVTTKPSTQTSHVSDRAGIIEEVDPEPVRSQPCSLKRVSSKRAAPRPPKSPPPPPPPAAAAGGGAAGGGGTPGGAAAASMTDSVPLINSGGRQHPRVLVLPTPPVHLTPRAKPPPPHQSHL